jgi:hypothetical protein
VLADLQRAVRVEGITLRAVRAEADSLGAAKVGPAPPLLKHIPKKGQKLSMCPSDMR